MWIADLKGPDGSVRRIIAKSVVNAAGPWVDQVLGRAIPGERHANLRLVKGSHLVFPKLYDGDHCYIFQNRDDRIVFAIPYEREFTLVGTTDVAFSGDANTIQISNQESAYICDAINEYLKMDVTPSQAVWSYSGVRPLYDDKSRNNSTVTRDYVFELDDPEDAPPILSIFGGKITTYRKLAEHALEKLKLPWLDLGKPWTAGAPLPGGDIPAGDFGAFAARIGETYSWIPAPALLRLCRAYGTLVTALIGDADSWAAMGTDFGAGLTEREVRYLIEHEYARTADDVLWRRSKLGLHMDASQRQAVSDWFAANGPK